MARQAITIFDLVASAEHSVGSNTNSDAECDNEGSSRPSPTRDAHKDATDSAGVVDASKPKFSTRRSSTGDAPLEDDVMSNPGIDRKEARPKAIPFDPNAISRLSILEMELVGGHTRQLLKREKYLQLGPAATAAQHAGLCHVRRGCAQYVSNQPQSLAGFGNHRSIALACNKAIYAAGYTCCAPPGEQYERQRSGRDCTRADGAD
jgi:hypothetical protein